MKMREGFRSMAIVMCMAVILGMAGPAAADNMYRESSEVDSMMNKLGRGISNVLTGWVEIPKQVGKSVRELDPFTGLVVGTVKGIGWGYARTVTGVYEVLTFPFPTPANYSPLLEPEFIVQDMWGEPLPILSDKPRYPTDDPYYRAFP